MYTREVVVGVVVRVVCVSSLTCPAERRGGSGAIVFLPSGRLQTLDRVYNLIIWMENESQMKHG